MVDLTGLVHFHCEHEKLFRIKQFMEIFLITYINGVNAFIENIPARSLSLYRSNVTS